MVIRFGVRRLAAALGWEGQAGLTSPPAPTPKREQAPALQTSLHKFTSRAAMLGVWEDA
jgi:hypothetical protein